MLFIYGTRLRPAGPGCQPQPFVRIIKTNDVRVDGVWSEIAYSRELTEAELEQFEMVYIRKQKGLKRHFVNNLHVEYWVEYTDNYRSRKVDGYQGSEHDDAWAAFRKLDELNDIVCASILLVVRDANGVAINKVKLSAWEVEGAVL